MEQNNISLKGKRILIFQQRSWGRGIGRFLAGKLHTEGCRLAALTSQKKTHDKVLRQTEVPYELIANIDEILSDPTTYLGTDYYPLGDICRDLGVNSIWPIASSLRMYVRSYADKYYYGFKQNVPDETIVTYVMAAYKCVRMIFEKFNPEIIIAPNMVGPHHIIMNLYARKRGVTMFGITDSKIKGMYMFSHDYLDSSGAFHDRVDALNTGTCESTNRKRAQQYIQEFRKKFIAPDYAERPKQKQTIGQMLRHELAPYYHSLKWYLNPPPNPWKAIGISTEWRPPHIMLRDHYAHKWNTWCANHFDYYPLEKIKKCIYLPLQYQPEAGIDVMACYFSNQTEVARLVAMAMPDDYTLIVKDHPAMLGMRDRSYLEKFARTINVKLIDYRTPVEQILKKADAVVSMNSTTIAEAAFLSKPAIQLGDWGTTLKLPNVAHHTDMTTLAKKIKEVLAINFKTPEYERRLENFVAAAYDAGFDVNYLGMWERGEYQKIEEFWEYYKKEIAQALGTQAS